MAKTAVARPCPVDKDHGLITCTGGEGEHWTGTCAFPGCGYTLTVANPDAAAAAPEAAPIPEPPKYDPEKVVPTKDPAHGPVSLEATNGA